MITKRSEILKKQKVHMSMFTFFRNTFKYKGGGEIGDFSSYKTYGGRGSGIRQFHTSPCTSSVSSAPMLCNRLIASLIDSSEGGCRSLPRTSCDLGQMYSNVRGWIRKDVASYCHSREKLNILSFTQRILAISLSDAPHHWAIVGNSRGFKLNSFQTHHLATTKRVA